MNTLLSVMSMCAVMACTPTKPFVYSENLSYHAKGSSMVSVSSGGKQCSGWWSGPKEITTAAHCSGGEIEIHGVTVLRVRIDFEKDIMNIETDEEHGSWLTKADPHDDDIVDVVSLNKGLVVTKVLGGSKQNSVLEWTASPGWSGSPAINQNGNVVCMVVAYYFSGGTKCVNLE